MDGILSDPKKWNEAVQNFVQEACEADDADEQDVIVSDMFAPL